MAESYQISPFKCEPGIKKDGTETEGNFWNDGLWTRFYRGLPRSMPGYRSMTNAFAGPSRGLFVNLNGLGNLDIFSGSSDVIEVGQFTTGGFGSGVNDITPMGFVDDPNNVWQMSSFYNANGGGEISLIAHAAPNLANIASDIATTVYYGDITAIVPLSPAMDDSMGPAEFQVSGGVVAIPPYVVAYGSLGLVGWSAINDPSLFPLASQANPTPTKIVKGISIRGAAAPACILWSLDSLILMTFTGGDTVWAFNTVTDQSSILSSSGPVEADSVYYWPGVDRWLVFNGTLRELPNSMNSDFFFTNLNFAQRQKVFGFKIPRWGEIWWCAPMFGATECNWAFIYNYRENTWYDTPLPSDGRSAAYFAQSWQYPIMAGANEYQNMEFQLWQHEFQRDEVIGNATNAIPSFIVSADISIIAGNLAPGIRWTELVGFEQDYNFGSALNFEILGRKYAQDTDTVLFSNPIVNGSVHANYFATPVQNRYLRWKIGSNVQNGYFVMGQPLIYWREGDAQP